MYFQLLTIFMECNFIRSEILKYILIYFGPGGLCAPCVLACAMFSSLIISNIPLLCVINTNFEEHLLFIISVSLCPSCFAMENKVPTTPLPCRAAAPPSPCTCRRTLVVSSGKVNRSAIQAAVPAVRSWMPKPGVETCMINDLTTFNKLKLSFKKLLTMNEIELLITLNSNNLKLRLLKN